MLQGFWLKYITVLGDKRIKISSCRQNVNKHVFFHTLTHQWCVNACNINIHAHYLINEKRIQIWSRGVFLIWPQVGCKCATRFANWRIVNFGLKYGLYSRENLWFCYPSVVWIASILYSTTVGVYTIQFTEALQWSIGEQCSESINLMFNYRTTTKQKSILLSQYTSVRARFKVSFR